MLRHDTRLEEWLRSRLRATETAAIDNDASERNKRKKSCDYSKYAQATPATRHQQTG